MAASCIRMANQLRYATYAKMRKCDFHLPNSSTALPIVPSKARIRIPQFIQFNNLGLLPESFKVGSSPLCTAKAPAPPSQKTSQRQPPWLTLQNYYFTARFVAHFEHLFPLSIYILD